jgi:transcriptional regulator with XRE-family HTH domain
MEQAPALHSAIYTALTSWLAANPENTGAEMARRSGVNASDISHIKNNKWVRKVGNTTSPIPSETYLKIAGALGVKLDEAAVHWDEYTIHQTIQQICGIAHSHRRFTLLDGMSGLGKSYGLSWYAKRNAKVVYIQATNTMSAVDLLSEVLTKFGRSRSIPTKGGAKSRLHAMHREIAAFVADNPGWLVIIDEMEDKARELYQAVKDLCDDFGRERQHRKGGLLVCGIGLYESWHKKHLRGQMPYSQLYTRFTEHYKPLLAGSPDEVRAFMAQEIQKLAKREGYTDSTALNWFSSKIDNMGQLNSLITDLNRILDSKEISRAAITANRLEAFYNN